MYAGKRCNSRSNLTKRYKLDRVASVDNRPPPDKNFGPKQVCWTSLFGYSPFIWKLISTLFFSFFTYEIDFLYNSVTVRTTDDHISHSGQTVRLQWSVSKSTWLDMEGRYYETWLATSKRQTALSPLATDIHICQLVFIQLAARN